MTAQIRAKRILSPLASYRPVETVGDGFSSLRQQALLQGATPIGLYINDQPEGDETVLVSDLGIFVESKHGKLFVEYKNITRVDIVAGNTLLQADASEKTEADGLLLLMADTSSKLIPIRNGNGKYRDVFEFARFMTRAVEDAKNSLHSVV